MAAVLFMLFVSGVLAVGLLEICARLFFPMSDFFWQWDPVIGSKLVPGKHGRSVKPGSFDVQVEANSVGFRDREHAVEKPAGVKRIVVLGDSFMEAIQVRFEESLPHLLEQKLQSRGPTEVINISVSGTGTAREYLALREYGLRYKPDLVLVFFVGNDISDNSKKLQGLSYYPYPQVTATGDVARDDAGRPLFMPFADQTSSLGAITGVLRDHSKGYRLAREVVETSPGVNRLLYSLGLISTPPETVNAPSGDNFGFYEIYRVQPKPAWAEAWKVTEQMMLATRDLAKANGSEFAIVLIPAAWEVETKAWDDILDRLPAMKSTAVDRDQPARLLSEFLQQNGVPVVNLVPDLRSHAQAGEQLYLRGDAHWTPAGHVAATDLVAGPAEQLLGR